MRAAGKAQGRRRGALQPAEAAAAAILGGFEDLPQEQTDESGEENASGSAEPDETTEGTPTEEASEESSEQEG